MDDLRETSTVFYTPYRDSTYFMEKDFNLVDRVLFSSSGFNKNDNIAPLNQTFTKLRHLTLLDEVRLADRHNVALYYQNLEYLSTPFQMHSESSVELIREIIKINPHIQSVMFGGIPASLLTFFNENLPTLTTLNIQMLLSKLNEEITFKTVTKLTAGQRLEDFTQKATFENLKTFEISYTRDAGSVWGDFIKRHSNITKLTVSSGLLSDVQLAILLESAPNAVEMSFPINPNMTAAAVIEPMIKSTKLQRLVLDLCDRQAPIISELNKTVGNEWKVKKIDIGCQLDRLVWA